MKIYEIFGSKDPVKRHAPTVYNLPDGSEKNDNKTYSIMAGKRVLFVGKTHEQAKRAVENPLLIKKHGKLHMVKE